MEETEADRLAQRYAVVRGRIGESAAEHLHPGEALSAAVWAARVKVTPTTG